MKRSAALVAVLIFVSALLAWGCGSDSTGDQTGKPCETSADCPTTECSKGACIQGHCTPKDAENGSAAPTQVPNDCRKNICAGGEVITVEDSSDVAADDANECTIEACIALNPGSTNAPAGTACTADDGKVCDGDGACVKCVVDTDCDEGFACSSEHKCVPDTCANGKKDGDETDIDCGGLCGATCQSGNTCGAPGDCASAFCADGVCCDTACTGECEACTAAKTGGTDGTCAPFPAGTDPDNECDPGVACGNTDGLCSGASHCNKAAAGTPCGDGPSCTNAVAKAQDACDGDGACEPGASTPCEPYLCDATACKDACTSNADCVATSVCDGSVCSAIKANGEACASDDVCTSGFCTDGFCCDAACDGPCEACAKAKKGSGMDGACGPVKSGTDPDEECSGESVCGGAGGTCKQIGGVSCSMDIDCVSGHCADGVCCDAACSGLCESCLANQTGAMADGICKPIVGGLDPDGECIAAQVCNGMGACVALANGVTCMNPVDCLSGFCVEGYCCNSACDTTCQACTTAKKGSGVNGTCGPIGSGNDPDNECPGVTACGGGGSCNLIALGQPCSLAGECSTSFCVDGVCCNNACSGACQACSAAKKGSGSGTCGPVASGTDPDSECAGVLVCDPMSACKLPDGQACQAPTDCATGFCVDGVCCNTACGATCQACSLMKKGTGADGVCGNIVNGQDPDFECGGATVCGGAGTCALLAIGATCTLPSECQSTFCVDGVCCNSQCSGNCQACTALKKGSGTTGQCGSIATGTDPDDECAGPNVCDSFNACKLPDASSCMNGSSCISGFCADGICCNAACTGTCQACTSGKKGFGAEGVCGNILNGQDPDSECGGATSCNGLGQCALLPAGSACSASVECQSVACVDGYCCNSACTDVCQACSAAKKGTGANGQCGNIVVGTDPDDECSTVQVCNGSGVCKVPTGSACVQNTDCLSAFCVDGVCCNTQCNTLCQACTSAKKGGGADGTCGSVAANTDPDFECPGATTCNGAACTLFANGASCTLNAECTSNQCVDGVCCNSACGGTCQACTAAKKGTGADGTCGPVAATTDPDNECPGVQNCNGAGACL